MDKKDQELDNAQQLVSQYGQILSQLDAASYGHPQSLLPDSKDNIKAAIMLLLMEVGGQDDSIKDSLAHAYTFLAQFVDDDKAGTVARCQIIMQSSDMGHEDWNHVEHATRIINEIKLEMEELLNDIRMFL